MKILKQLMICIAHIAGVGAAQAATSITVHKSPACGCCEKYVDYLRENGFAVKAVNESDMDAIKKRHGVSYVASCQGHVPVAAIRKLLKDKPAIAGISAPSMPMNSPGMGEMEKGTLTIYAVPRNRQEPYVFSIE